MNDDIEYIVGAIIILSLVFGLGFSTGYKVANDIKTNDLAKTLYKDTNKYIQHRNDNFYHLLRLVEIKEQ